MSTRVTHRANMAEAGTGRGTHPRERDVSGRRQTEAEARELRFPAEDGAPVFTEPPQTG